MKQQTHVRLTLDVLKDWEDVLDFEIDEVVSSVVRTINSRIDKEIKITHHRTRHAFETSLYIIYYTLKARKYWLAFVEGGLDKYDPLNLTSFVQYLSAALHLVQDFAAWSLSEPHHSFMEDNVDIIYEPLRKRFRASRKKIYEMYWELKNTYTTATDPRSYIKEAYKRSSELISFVISKRRLKKTKAEEILMRYSGLLPEVLYEVRYWDRLGIVWRPFAALIVAFGGYGVLFNNNFYLNLELLLAPFFALMYVTCKVCEKIKNKMKYDIFPDAPEMALSLYSRYFKTRPNPESAIVRNETSTDAFIRVRNF